jgi:hypothetical protein
MVVVVTMIVFVTVRAKPIALHLCTQGNSVAGARLETGLT